MEWLLFNSLAYLYYPAGNLQSNTEVWIVWALQNSADGNAGLTKHSATGVFPTKHNLIKEAGGAGVTVPTPTSKSAATEAGSRVVACIILALSASRF